MYTRDDTPMIMEVGLHRLIEVAGDLGQIIRYDEEHDSYWIGSLSLREALSNEESTKLTPYIVHNDSLIVISEAICCTHARAFKDTSSLPPYEFVFNS